MLFTRLFQSCCRVLISRVGFVLLCVEENWFWLFQFVFDATVSGVENSGGIRVAPEARLKRDPLMTSSYSANRGKTF